MISFVECRVQLFAMIPPAGSTVAMDLFATLTELPCYGVPTTIFPSPVTGQEAVLFVIRSSTAVAAEEVH